MTFLCSAALFSYSLSFPTVYLYMSSKILHLHYGFFSSLYSGLEQYFCIFFIPWFQTL